MKKLLFLSLGLGALGLVAACSQTDKHPANLGDCDSCSQPVIGTTGGDASAVVDAAADAKADAGVDASADATVDSSSDALLDVAIPDVGPPDVINLDGASE